MGDMKTPDFDDLLAAFDIPDIDAKEAIQSSPEEGGDEEGKAESRGPSPCSPCSPAPQGDLPVVSVIVKNRVRPESFGEAEGSVRDDIDAEEKGKLGGALLASQLNPKMPDIPLEPQMHNGFEGSVHRSQGETNGELWSCQSPLSSTVTASEDGSARHTADLMNRLKPLSPKTSTSTAPSVPFTSISSSSPTPLSDNQHLPLHFTQNEDTAHLSSPPSAPPPPNRTVRAGIRHVIESDQEDSEPDLGSPLVIQESPGSQMSSPPKFPEGSQVFSELLGSPQSSPRPLPCPPPLSSSLTPSNPKPKPLKEMPLTHRSPPSPTPQPQGPRGWPSSTSVQEEEYPEHVIDERDSPESPPPDQTGFLVPKRSPSLAPAPAPASNHEESHDQEEPMESKPSQVSRPEEVNGMEGEKTDAVDGENTDKENPGIGSSSLEATSTNAAGATSSSSRPLKVKIKTVKTPTGSITRTVTRVAPKGAGGALSKGVDSSKPSPGGRKIVSRPKRMVSQQFKKGMSKPGELLPTVSTFQDASTAMLAAASKVQNKTAMDTKPRVSATAVSITKSAALPSVSSSPRISPGGISMRSLGQRTLTSGLTVSSPVPPIPPQGSSRPASIVNNTGAIISKSQSSLVEAFNKILNSKNLLPSYKPDLTSPLPAEWGLPLPAQGYRCLECGDAFALERSLARHYDRRSLRIEVTCNHCAKRLAFFNKCSLLLHAREHKERGLVMQCSHLVMRPVAVEQMIGQQEPTTSGMLSTSLLSSSIASSSSALTLATSSPAPQLQQPIPSKKTEAVQYTNNKCPECQVQFCSRAEVAAHFQDIKPAHTISCMQCSPPMLLPNGCSAAAHQRIHKACPPYICPECGGTAKQPAFQNHLDETCLHFARRIGYRCSSCQVVFGGLNSVKSHIEVAHCDMFHKCPSCPMAFKSAPSAQSHISAQHPTLTGGQAKIIYKCVMCDTVFTQKSLLYVHFDTHLAKQKVHVFKCPDCTKLYSQRTSLMDHIKSVHKGPTVKQEIPPSSAPSSRPGAPVKMESSDGEEWEDQEEEEDGDGERAKTNSGWSCVPCHARYSDKEDYITHMAEQHDKVLKKFPCNKCESSFTSTSSLRRHIRIKHKGIKQGFHCQLCTEGDKTFSSRVMLERHIQLRHGMNALSQDTQLKGVGGLDDADSSSEQDGGPGPQRGRRGAVKMEVGEDATDGASPAKKTRSSVSSAPAPSSLPRSGFRCAPCGFTTEDRAVFLEHIPQHRSEGAGGLGPQCLQCGACFTSTPSLSRHRFITHRVRDTPPDNHRNDRPEPSPGNAGNHDDTTSPWSSVPVSPSSHPSVLQRREEGEGKLACKVCGKHFEKPTDLNTHFRTHGMAFISARNAGKST